MEEVRKSYIESMFRSYPEDCPQKKFITKWLESDDAKQIEMIWKKFKSDYGKEKNENYETIEDEVGEKFEEVVLELMD